MKKMKKTGIFFLVLAMLFTSFAVFTGNGLTEVNASSSKFPYNSTYKYGYSSLADDQSAANSMLLAEWEDWKATYITSNGARGFRRVQRDAGTNFDTVSEGLGYGMILAVYFDDQSLFDDLYGYVKTYHNGNGLMGWQIDSNGNIVGSGGKDCASDADEDMALALVFASKKWGSGRYNYGQEATNLINNLYNYCVEQGTYVLKPGDTWGGSQVTNPSYFAPAWYKVFAQFTGDSRWNRVADKCYEIIDKVNRLNGGTGLVPDWCTADGTQSSGMGYNYSYDAARYPWRTAIDYSWFGDTRAKNNCDLIADFFKKQGGATGIVDGYTIQGSKTGQYHNATFIGPVASASMTGSDLKYAKELYNETIAVKDGGDYHYYGNSLRLMTLLYLTGNFPNLLEDSSGPGPTPPPTTEPTAGPTTPPIQEGDLLIDSFEGAFSWITYDGEGASVDAAKAARDGGGSAMEVTYKGSASGYWGVLKSMVGTDISKATGMSFDIKGTNNQVRLMLVEEGSIAGEDGEQWEYVISPRNSWTTVEISMSQFSPRSDWQPPGADGNKRLNLDKIISIHFAGMNANAGSFMVDNVKFTGLPVVEPTEPPRTPPPTTPPPKQVSYGDINDDGVINSLDYALLGRHILELSAPNANLDNADLNGDGIINSLDATILSRYLLEIIDKFPVEN